MASAESEPKKDRNWVIGIVVSWLVGGLLTFNREVVGGILDVFDAYVASFDAAGSSAITAFSEAGAATLGSLEVLNSALAGAAYDAGPAGPIVAVALFVVLAVASAVVLRGILNALKWIT